MIGLAWIDKNDRCIEVVVGQNPEYAHDEDDTNQWVVRISPSDVVPDLSKIAHSDWAKIPGSSDYLYSLDDASIQYRMDKNRFHNNIGDKWPIKFK